MDKRALKREYKEARQPMGVYRVHNTVSDRSLVGSSVNVPAMLNRQKAQLTMCMHTNRALQKDWTELGSGAFAFEVLDTLSPLDQPDYDTMRDLHALEEMWLERLSPFDERGYNRAPK